MEYDYKIINGHIEVFLNGIFQFSADNISEAIKELKEMGGDFLVEKRCS